MESLKSENLALRKRPSSSSSYTKRRIYSLAEDNKIKLNAKENGKLSHPRFVIANSFNEFLSVATTKLCLPKPARRIFNENGEEIFNCSQLKDRDLRFVYVSMGENYRMAEYDLLRSINSAKGYRWSLDGVSKNDEKEPKEKENRPLLTIIAYENGNDNERLHTIKVYNEDKLKDIKHKFARKMNWSLSEKCMESINKYIYMYDWHGNRINSMHDLPQIKYNEIDDSIDKYSPVWITQPSDYEFNPESALKVVSQHTRFFNNLISKKQKSIIPNDEKLFQFLAKLHTANKTDNLSSLVENLEDLSKNLEDKLNKFKEDSRKTEEISTKSKIFGGIASKGLKINFFLNGTNTRLLKMYFNQSFMRGFYNSSKLSAATSSHHGGIVQLLEELNRKVEKIYKSYSKKITRLFDETGRDIKDLREIKYDQRVWMSTGDDWIDTSVKLLAMKANFVRVYESAENSKLVYLLQDSSAMPKKDLRSKKWNYDDIIEISGSLQQRGYNFEKDYTNTPSQLENYHKCLQASDEKDLIIYPQLAYENELLHSNVEVSDTVKSWIPKDFATWIFEKDGQIINKLFPQLCLTLSTRSAVKIKAYYDELDAQNDQYYSSEITFDGYCVELTSRKNHDSRKTWKFSSEGFIYCEEVGDRFALTSFSDFKETLNDLTKNSKIKEYSFESNMEKTEQDSVTLVLFEVITNQYPVVLRSLSLAQRWALKEKISSVIPSSKYSVLSTSEWHKRGYSWPVNEKNELIEEMNWPIKAYLIPCVTPLKSLKYRSKELLKVLANGELDKEKAVEVNLSNLLNFSREIANCTYMSLDELRFDRFLEECTTALNLPWRGRRLFDENGQEYNSLETLNKSNRNMLFYVSCGEAWIDVNSIIKENIKSAQFLNLLHDAEKLSYFSDLCKLMNLSIVLQATSIREGARLQIKPRIKPRVVKEQLTLTEMNNRQLNKKKVISRWASEGRKNEDKDKSVDEPKDKTENEGEELFIEGKAHETPEILQQKFLYDEDTGHIYASGYKEKRLVLGVRSSEGKSNEVILMRHNENDMNQIWKIKDSIIYLRFKPYLVLTVQYTQLDVILKQVAAHFSTLDRDVLPLSIEYLFETSFIALENRFVSDNGNANQKWGYSISDKRLTPFDTNETDKKLTATLKSNICTYFLSSMELEQPGYYIISSATPDSSGVSTSQERKYFCPSCSAKLRRTTNLKALKKAGHFTCASGDDDRSVSCFKYLTRGDHLNLDDLRAVAHDELNSLKNTMNLKYAPKDGQMRFLVHRNGEGYKEKGYFVTGHNVVLMLESATKILKLPSAARIFYAEDGTKILSFEDLEDFIKRRQLKKSQEFERVTSASSQRGSSAKTVKKNETISDLFSLKHYLRDMDFNEEQIFNTAVDVWVSTGDKFQDPKFC